MISQVFTSFVCSLMLMFSALDVPGQHTAGTAPSAQLTTEQKAVLSEALQLTRKVIQLHGGKKFDEAFPLARRAVELRRSVLGDDDPLVAEAITNVAGLHLGKQEFERAESLMKQALSSYDKASRITANTAYLLDTLTLLRWRVRDYDRAEAYGKRAIEAKEKLYGERNLQILDSLHNLIRVYEANAKRQEANALYLRILSLAENSKANLPERLAQMLIIYRCSHRDAKQTADTLATDRRIEDLLGWHPDAREETVSQGILNGQALSLPQPTYPDQARLAQASGSVVVEVTIDECGKVINAKALSGHAELRAVSVAAARNARFSPTLLKGFPVSVKGIIHYNFVYR